MIKQGPHWKTLFDYGVNVWWIILFTKTNNHKLVSISNPTIWGVWNSSLKKLYKIANVNELDQQIERKIIVYQNILTRTIEDYWY